MQSRSGYGYETSTGYCYKNCHGSSRAVGLKMLSSYKTKSSYPRPPYNLKDIGRVFLSLGRTGTWAAYLFLLVSWAHFPQMLKPDCCVASTELKG